MKPSLALFFLLLSSAYVHAEELQDTYEVSVEEIPLLATVDGLTFGRLCTEEAYRKTVAGYRIPDCGGVVQIVKIPAQGNQSEQTLSFHLGKKTFPGLLPKELQGVFTSALAEHPRLRLQDGAARKHADSNSTRRPRGPLIVRAKLTELNYRAEENTAGFGGGYALLAMVSAEKKNISGFVRFDVMVIDSATREVVAALPLAGTAQYEQLEETMFTSRDFELERREALPLLIAAARVALSNGVGRLVETMDAYYARQ